MSNSDQHPDWHEAKHFIVGYGSLMSMDSRTRFSSNPYQPISVLVRGFKRHWVTRSFAEQQTYVGATKELDSQLNGHCVPVALNPSLQKREQDYRFQVVDKSAIELTVSDDMPLYEKMMASDTTVWICESLQTWEPTSSYPIHQTYIDTCLSGCLAHGGINEAKQFVQLTSGWGSIVNDRQDPRYPRAAKVSDKILEVIDNSLMCLLA